MEKEVNFERIRVAVMKFKRDNSLLENDSYLKMMVDDPNHDAWGVLHKIEKETGKIDRRQLSFWELKHKYNSFIECVSEKAKLLKRLNGLVTCCLKHLENMDFDLRLKGKKYANSIESTFEFELTLRDYGEFTRGYPNILNDMYLISLLDDCSYEDDGCFDSLPPLDGSPELAKTFNAYVDYTSIHVNKDKVHNKLRRVYSPLGNELLKEDSSNPDFGTKKFEDIVISHYPLWKVNNDLFDKD